MCRNASLGLCQCEMDEWKTIQKGGVWSSIMSPYEERYIDVRFVGGASGSVSVAVEEGAAVTLLPLITSFNLHVANVFSIMVVAYFCC